MQCLRMHWCWYFTCPVGSAVQVSLLNQLKYTKKTSTEIFYRLEPVVRRNVIETQRLSIYWSGSFSYNSQGLNDHTADHDVLIVYQSSHGRGLGFWKILTAQKIWIIKLYSTTWHFWLFRNYCTVSTFMICRSIFILYTGNCQANTRLINHSASLHCVQSLLYSSRCWKAETTFLR